MIVVGVVWAKLAESYRAKRLEWFFATALLIWGVVLLWPGSTFDSSRSYALLKWWAPETRWGFWFLLAGTVRLIVLIINGAWWRTAFFRAVTAFYSLFFWFSLSLGIALANPNSTGLVYIAVFFFEISNMRLAGREAGTLERFALARARLPETGWKGFALYVIGVGGRPNAGGN